jgi:ATP-binding cassette subfamily B protein
MKKNAKQTLLLKEKREQRRIKYSSYMGGKRKPGEKPKDFKGTARRYFGLLQPHKTIMILVVSAGIIGAAVSVGGPMVLGDVVDAIQQEVARKLTGSEPDIVSTIKMLLKLLAIYGTSTVLNFVQNFTMAGITKKVICSLRERVNDKLSRLPLRFFDNKPKGDIMSRMVNDIDNISNSFQHSIIQIITSVVTAVGVFACMLYVNWRMTLLLLFILPVSLLLVLAITRRSKRHFKAQWDRTGELNGHIEEMFTGHKLIKIFGREQDAKDEFDDINDQLALVSRKAQFMSGLVDRCWI